MGFDSWNCRNTQSQDPYAFEMDDGVNCLTRQRIQHKSVAKQKRSCTSNFSYCVSRLKQEYSCNSSWHVSQGPSSQINKRTTWKENNRIQTVEKSYRFFKSRSCFSLFRENLKSGINFGCASQEHNNAEYSSQNHCLADNGNEENKSFTTQDVSLFPSSSFIKKNQTNCSSTAKAIVLPKEENISSLVSRIVPHTNIEKSVSLLSEPHTSNLKSISQNSKMPSDIAEPFMLLKYTKNMQHKRKQKKILAKPNKFFKSRNRNVTSSCSLGCYARNSCAHQDRESFNIEKYISEKDCPNSNKPVSKDPYSFETEDENNSNEQNNKFQHVRTENKYIYQDRGRHSKEKHLPGTYTPKSKSQSNYPHLFEMDDDHETTVNKKFKSVAKQTALSKGSNVQLSNEAEHLCNKHRYMPSLDANSTKASHSLRKNFKSSKIKAINQPLIGKTNPEFKEEIFLPINNATTDEILRPINKSDEVLTPSISSKNKNLNLRHKIRHQVDHLSSSVTHKGRNGQLPIAVKSKKCSIGYTYVIKNSLSAVTQRRNRHEDNNAENILRKDKEIHTTRLSSENIYCEKENTSSNKTNKSAHVTIAAFSPVIRNLAKLNIHSNSTKKKLSGIINETDNDKRNLMSDAYMACNKTTLVKPSLETKKFCTPEINDTVKLKQTTKCSYISFNKNCDTEMEISHNKNAKNCIVTDAFDSASVADETENSFEKATDDFQLSHSLQQKDSQKVQRNIFTDGIDSNRHYQTTITISPHEEHKKENQMKSKENSDGKSLIKLKTNAIPTQIKTTNKTSGSETKHSTKQKINNINKKTYPLITKRSASIKKRIFISNQRKKCGNLYTHKWVEDTEGEKDTKMSPTGLLVQPIGVINTHHELEELRSPLLCVASKHTQSTNKAKAERDLKSDELDKKYFTIIKNVRKSDKIQELGELQEFNDDIEYILQALQDSNPITTRCHSALMLASKFLIPEFRTNVKAYSAMTKFFYGLHDAAEDQSLALCTAAIMFILGQHQMFMYMSSNGTQLLLSLLNSRLTCEVERIQLQNIKKKVLELCTQVEDHAFVKHLYHENITANHLASETLLSITSCDTAYLLEDHLRDIGGLEHIVTAINSCKTEINGFFVQWRRDLIDKLRFLHCCLQILECVTYQNEENQLYLLKHENSCFMGTVAVLFSKCIEEIKSAHQVDSVSCAVMFELLFTILKLLINLTHSNNNTSIGSSLVAKRPEIIHVSMYVLSEALNCAPEEKKFDLLALVLMFLINTVEHNICNRKLIFEAKASDIMIHSNSKHTMNVLIELFYHQEKLARIEAFKTDAMLDDQIDSELSQEPLEPSQEFIATLQEKAGQNMEYTMIASYLVLLIGYLIVDNEEYELYARQCLPQKSFSTMISVLEKMHNFLNLVPAISSKHDIMRTQYIIQYLRQSDDKVTAATANEYYL